MTEKLALVLQRKDVVSVIPNIPAVSDPTSTDAVLIVDDTPKELFDLKPLLLPRSVCETDTNHLQIIPYMLVVFNNRVLTYRRGKAGAESRLFDLYSLGFGGHIDELPKENESFKELIAREASRELKEELGIDVEFSEEEMDLTTVVYSDATPVEEVHLGLAFCVQLTEASVKTVDMRAEQGIIDDLRWQTPDQIIQGLENGAKMELWSSMILAKMTSIAATEDASD